MRHPWQSQPEPQDRTDLYQGVVDNTWPPTVANFADRVIDSVESVIVGKRPQIELLMVALSCKGHVLIEDVPGTGKTMLARAVAASLGLSFRRLQCTPDLLPNDVTGGNIFDQESGQFQFRAGPIFANVLLVDEINRATPRAQAALLEAMQEGQVTVDGTTRQLPDPFLVLATQNPIEFEGTFPLPEAQLDRFLLRLSLGYPDEEDERRMLRNLRGRHPIEAVEQVADGDELAKLHELVAAVHVDAAVERYVVRLMEGTRSHPDVALGASPRGSLALYKTAQARAFSRHRDYVIPEDVKELAQSAMAHRLIIKPESQLRGKTPESVLDEVLQGTEVELAED